MEFKIFRASDGGQYLADETPKPCEEAILKGDGLYVIQINSLEELLSFVEKEGQIILGREKPDSPLFITIYDDWME